MGARVAYVGANKKSASIGLSLKRNRCAVRHENYDKSSARLRIANDFFLALDQMRTKKNASVINFFSAPSTDRKCGGFVVLIHNIVRNLRPLGFMLFRRHNTKSQLSTS